MGARVISLGPGLAAIPERLLLAHARGEVLFLAGAGISQQVGLPDFRDLVLKVYEKLDTSAHGTLFPIPRESCNQWMPDISGLTNKQAAEIKRFINGDYDVVLGMLERRIDGQSHSSSRVRQTIGDILRAGAVSPGSIHRALMRLADRGGAVTIVTTNFELLLERAARRTTPPIQTYSLGESLDQGAALTLQEFFIFTAHWTATQLELPIWWYPIRTLESSIFAGELYRILSTTQPDYSILSLLAIAQMIRQCDIS